MIAVLLRDVARRPLRSLFTIIGVGVAAAAYILLVGSVASFVRQFRDLSPMLGADLVVQQAGAPTPFASLLPEGETVAIRHLPGVGAASAVGLGRARTPVSGWCLIIWLDPMGQLAAKVPIVRGVALRREGQVLLGQRLAASAGLAPGASFGLRDLKLQVSGIFATDQPLLDGAAIVSLGDGQRLFGVGNGVSLVLVDLAAGAKAGAVGEEIRRRIPGVEVTNVAEYVGTVSLLRIVSSFARLLALLAVAIAALGAASVLSLSVQERVHEIAVLRAVGWRKWRIAGLVTGEGFCLSLAGWLVAVPLSVVVLELLRRYGPGAEIGLLPTYPPPAATLEALAITMIAAALGAAVPVARALAVTPASAFRSG